MRRGNAATWHLHKSGHCRRGSYQAIRQGDPVGEFGKSNGANVETLGSRPSRIKVEKTPSGENMLSQFETRGKARAAEHEQPDEGEGVGHRNDRTPPECAACAQLAAAQKTR